MNFTARLRRRAGGAAVNGFFRGIARAGSLHPQARPSVHGVEVLRDIAYGPYGVAHQLDVYRPVKRSGPLPIVLYLHGGGFRILSKETHWLMGLAFARAGFVVFNANYRLAPEHPFPAAAQDACSVYRWAVDNASRFGGDAERIVVAGESAGANLAAVLAVGACYERPEPWARTLFDIGVVPIAAIPICGILQVTDIARFGRRRPLSPILLDRLAEVGRGYVGAREVADGGLADPLCVLEAAAPERALPPFFVAVGTADPILDDSRRLAAALARHGVDHEARYYEGEVHAFHAFVWREAARRCWRDTYDFLDRVAPRPGRD